MNFPGPDKFKNNTFRPPRPPEAPRPAPRLHLSPQKPQARPSRPPKVFFLIFPGPDKFKNNTFRPLRPPEALRPAPRLHLSPQKPQVSECGVGSPALVSECGFVVQVVFVLVVIWFSLVVGGAAHLLQ